MAIKPSWVTDKKERFNDTPWMVIDQEWRMVEVIKAWHNNPLKEDGTARWMVKAYMPGNEDMADYGDEYSRNIIAGGGTLVAVLGETPTLEQHKEWAELRNEAESVPDPFDRMDEWLS